MRKLLILSMCILPFLGIGSYAANGNVAISTPVQMFTDSNGMNYNVKIFTDIRPI